MQDTQTFPQLSFSLSNPGQDNTIYVTTDPTVNKLVFRVKTNKDNTVFSSGQLVPPTDAPTATGSILYLDLSTLQIPEADFSKIVCSSTDWDYALYPNSIIGLVPTKDITLNQGSDTVEIKIENLVLPTPPSSPNVNLSVSYYRVSPITIGNLAQLSFFKVLLQAAPEDKKDLHNAIDCILTTPPIIVNTVRDYPQVDNSITFAFKPGSNPVVVKAGPKTTFTVSFVYAPSAPGYGALTTPQSARDNIVVAQGENASGWSVTPNTDAQNPCWILQPPANAEIVGTGAGAIVSFYITEIMTSFQPGSTLMYVQYQDVPGFNDGSDYMTLTKIPHVVINNLTITPNPSVIKNGEASVTISWNAKDYQSLMLMPFYQDVTNKNSFKATLKKSTVITLVANGAATTANQATKTTTADVLPVINSFKVTPKNIYYNNYPHDAKFFWDVDTNDSVLLVNDVTGSKESVPKTSTQIKSITTPGMWSLIPQNEENPYTLLRNVLIQSFKVNPQSDSLSFKSSSVVASPSAEFLAALDIDNKKVHFLNSLDYTENAIALSTDGTPIDQVFAHSGSYLFVLNNKAGAVNIIKILRDPSTGNYSFSKLSSIKIAGTPARIAISGDDKYIFVTTDLEGKGNFIVIENKGADQFSIKQTIQTYQSPMGIAVDPSGTNVYVAIKGDNSICVMAYSSVNDAFMYSRSISNLPQNPVDVAVADENGKTLLVACYATNQVMVVDYDDDGTSPRQSLSVNNSPIRIVTTTDRAYAFVINYSSGNASLISCSKGTGSCSVIDASIKTGPNPLAISMAYDNTAAYIANSDKSVTTFNLINYQLRSTPVDIGKQPTNVIATADGKKLVAWHNVLFISNKPDFTKGLYIYETASGAISTRLEDDSIVDCVVSPVASVGLMYVIEKSSTEIKIMETGTFNVTGSISIPAGEGDVSRYPVELSMSADGKNLYTVVKDSAGNYSFIAFTCDEKNATYNVNTDVFVFKNVSTSNSVLLQNTPDGTHAFVLSSLDKKIWTLIQDSNHVYQLSTTQISLSILTKTMAVSPDNSKLYVVMQQNMKTSIASVNISDLTSIETQMPSSYAILTNFQQAVVSPDSTRLFVTDANTAGVRIISTTTLRIIQTLTWQQNLQYPTGIAILPNGSSIYLTGFNSNNLAVINQIS